MKTRVPIQNILLDLGATACLETPNNPNAWSRCCSLCRLLASTQHVMKDWSIKKSSSPIIIIDFSITIIKFQSGASMSFSFLGSRSRLQRWWNKKSSILGSHFLVQCSTDIIWCPTGAVKPLKQDIPHLFSSSGTKIQAKSGISISDKPKVDCFDFRKCTYCFSPPVTCWQCPM